MAETARRGRTRGGGGAARRAQRTAVSFETARFIERNIPNFEVLTEEALQIIELNAEIILEEVGVNFPENPAALQRWRDAGADVQGDRVHIPRGLARKLCATAPPAFTQHARNPARNVDIGGRNLVLAPVYGPPFVRDVAGGRRYATMADFNKFVKLAYMSKWLHHSGGTVCEPTDIPVNKRHLDMLHAHMTLSDKPFMGSVTEPSRAQDSVDMCGLLFGADFVQQNTVMTSLININSPMTFDDVMMGALEVYASNNQACIISPFIVGGAMAPVSVAGTLTQVLAETLAGIAYSQLIRPDPKVSLGLGRLERELTREDEVVTYVSRNLERTRGFHIFMRALPQILRERPNARVLVVGGNEVSYGGKSKHPGGLRAEMEAEVGKNVDWDRVHFLGNVPYSQYQKLIQLSRCHIYLTMPFVLSWSLLEAMSMGATIVASDVAPVREAIEHGKTGLLVDFFDPQAVAAQVVEVLAKPQEFARIGKAARDHVVREYDFLTRCLPEHIAQINALVPADKQIKMPG